MKPQGFVGFSSHALKQGLVSHINGLGVGKQLDGFFYRGDAQKVQGGIGRTVAEVLWIISVGPSKLIQGMKIRQLKLISDFQSFDQLQSLLDQSDEV